MHRSPYAPPHPQPERAADLRALLIGVDDYTRFGPGASLGGPVRDLRDWELVARRLGAGEVAVVASPFGRVTGAPRADRANVLASVEALAGWLGEVDGREALLVFAGHGDVDVTDEGVVPHVCPEDIAPGAPPIGRIAVDDLLAPFRALDTTFSLTVILECCFSGLPAATRTEVGFGRARSLREVPMGEARLRLAEDDRVVVVAAATGVAWEYWLGGEWRGMFTWAATATLDRWNVRSDEKDRWVDLSYGHLVESARALIAQLRLPQQPTMAPMRRADHAVLQRLHLPPAPTTRAPANAGRGMQLSGDVSGYRVYQLTVNSVVVGQVVVTSPSPAGNLPANTEFWDLKLADLAGEDFRFTLTSSGNMSTSLPAGIGGTTWTSTLDQVDTNRSSTLPGSNYTWIKTGGSAIPHLRIDPVNQQTVWIRDSSTDLCGGWSVNDYADFTHSPNAIAYTAKCWSRDVWGTWP